MITVQFTACRMGESDDPYLMAGFPLAEWKHTEKGSWVCENALEMPVYKCIPNSQMGYDVVIEAKFSEQMAVQFALKWDIDKQLVS